ncbi:unnamed protein product [Lota lota]
METKSIAKSIASGLAPPSAGSLLYQLCRRHVDQIVLVSDEEIKTAVSVLYRSGLVVEPSGAAAFAAVVAGDKIPDVAGKSVHPERRQHGERRARPLPRLRRGGFPNGASSQEYLHSSSAMK